MKALLIAEKPDLMRKIKAVYDKHGHETVIRFKAFVGHTMRLGSPAEHNEDWSVWDLKSLPMIPTKFTYFPTDSKINIYRDLKSELSKDYDFVINACDAGREGQHIFYSFYDSIGCTLPVKRFWCHDLTEKEILRALNSLEDDSSSKLKNLTAASKLRCYFDWIVGMNFSRAYSLKVNRPARIGRVKTPTLKILVERELQVANFKPKDFWEVNAIFDGYEGVYFFMEDGKIQTQLFDKTKAENIKSQIGSEGKIVKVESKDALKYAPELYSLSSLQSDGNKSFGYTLSQSLEIAQSLYDKGIISYPRTSSSHLTQNIASTFEELLNCISSSGPFSDVADDILKDASVLSKIAGNKKYVDNKKVGDHYALIPTGERFNFDSLSVQEQNILNLILKRFLSIFLPPMIVSKSLIVTETNELKFRTTGSVVKQMGFMSLYELNKKDVFIPNLNEGDTVEVKDSKTVPKSTTPPSRLSEGSLVSIMQNPAKFLIDSSLKNVITESKGIGTEATRASIIEELINGQMAQRNKKLIVPTDYGIELITAIGDGSITSVDLTGEWEGKLLKVEAGDLDYRSFYLELLHYVRSEVEAIRGKRYKNLGQNKSKAQIIGKCPVCGQDVVVGKKFYFCEDYKSQHIEKPCSFIIPFELCGTKLNKTDLKKLLKKETTDEKTFTWKSGKKGNAKLKLRDNGSIEFLFS